MTPGAWKYCSVRVKSSDSGLPPATSAFALWLLNDV
jgi:hypothetical protein